MFTVLLVWLILKYEADQEVYWFGWATFFIDIALGAAIIDVVELLA